MKSFEIERNRTNTEALDAEIRASLGAAYQGLSTKPGSVTLYFADEVSGTQMQAARDLAILHDPSVLSARQAFEQNRQDAIADARERYTAGLDVSDYDAESSPIQALASRLAWLEQEIRDLRGL